jgi:hypothetical protein
MALVIYAPLPLRGGSPPKRERDELCNNCRQYPRVNGQRWCRSCALAYNQRYRKSLLESDVWVPASAARDEKFLEALTKTGKRFEDIDPG